MACRIFVECLSRRSSHNHLGAAASRLRGGWRTKSGRWVRTVEEVEADLTETFGRAVDADEYERGLPIAPVARA